MRSLMRVSSVEIAASPLDARPPTRNDGGRTGSVHRRTGRTVGRWPDRLQRTGLGRVDPLEWRAAGRWGRTPRACDPTSHRLCSREDTSVSSLWTPSGEHRPADEPADPGSRAARRDAGPSGSRPPKRSRRCGRCTPGSIATPVEDVVANHALGIWQLALVHLGVVTPPDADGTPPPRRPRGGRPRDRRDGRARRRPRRPARCARAGAARRAHPGADAVRRDLRRRPPTRPPISPDPAGFVSRELAEPVVLTGRFVRLEPVDARARRRRSRPPRPRTAATYEWTPVPDGEAEFTRERRPGARGAGRRPPARVRDDPRDGVLGAGDASSARRRTSTRNGGPAVAGGSTASRSARRGSRRRRNARR